MRLAVASTVVLVLGAAAPANAVSETAEGFSRTMQGCWNRVDANDGASHQMCLDGGITGALTIIECLNHDDLTECSSQEGRYEFRDEKFWRSYEDGPLAGGLDNCDVRLEAGKQVELHNCQWITEPDLGAATQDAVFERAIGQ
jgi:hypothetical protein